MLPAPRPSNGLPPVVETVLRAMGLALAQHYERQAMGLARAYERQGDLLGLLSAVSVAALSRQVARELAAPAS